ncbi:MAG TPA: UxaA family hydrolase [Candidatus Avamphibacillus sp.]|nr:UxaA family hydrolase [Candidatus Avamphibacillus sp.]
MSYTFGGFKRDDGTAGTRNYVGIVSSVICSSAVVREISEKVNGTIPIVHANGCAQLGDDFKLTRNMLVGMSTSPNVHSALLVGLGCETNQVGGLLRRIPKVKPVEGIGIQQLAGGTNTIEKGVSIAEKWTEEADKQARTKLPMSQLTVGILNVDMDEEAFVKAGSAVSEVVDKLVENDAKVIFGLSKTLEPAGDELSKRIIDPTDKENLSESSKELKRYHWEDPSKNMRSDEFSAEETKLAALESKITGTHPINSIIDYGEFPEDSGLYMTKVSSNVVESLSKMASNGCNIVLIVSNRGVLTGSIALPCMTLAPENNESLFDELIDYSIEGNDGSDESEKIIQEMLEISSGKQSQLEKLELGDFSIPHLGTTY